MTLPGLSVAELASLIGGIGLFLLGMRQMSDGLKAAAGEQLKTALGQWTSSRRRGFVTGLVVTALVQSSSAVIVALIGFVNAGLLSLPQAVWVVFGANVGTTMTGWLVALIGVKIKMEALALPLIGIGMALRLASNRARIGAIGMAITGFGLFFLGVDILQKAFAAFGDTVDVSALPVDPVAAIAIFVGLGFFLTVITQSSSAALVIVLTAAAGDAVSLTYAAAAVIGTNIGTTSTALLATIGATPNARRVAAAHIVFNVMAAAIALALLPVLLRGIETLREGMGLGSDPATTLALFHTAFNLLGVAAIWPLSDALLRYLQRSFRSPVEDLAAAQHLDANLLAVPELSLAGLVLETNRLSELARVAVHKSLTGNAFAIERNAALQLGERIQEHVAAMSVMSLPERVGAALPSILRAVQHYEEVATRADQPAALLGLHGEERDAADRLIRDVDALAGMESMPDGNLMVPVERPGMPEIETSYQALKASLLAAASRGALPVTEMDRAVRTAANLRRLADRTAKAEARLAPLADVLPKILEPGASSPNNDMLRAP
jgi:phosphate:Na+ symporter